MPPFREGQIKIDRGLSGDLLKFLREVGHGHRVNVVDASYDIPRGATVLDYPGSSAAALVGILSLIPIEGDEVTYMETDQQLDRVQDHGSVQFAARAALHAVQDGLKEDGIGIAFDGRYRLDEQETEKVGFYSMANGQLETTTFVRTIDDLPYACASLVVGHSQRTE